MKTNTQIRHTNKKIMETQLKILEFDYLKERELITINDRGNYILSGLKEHLPELYNYIMIQKKVL